MRVRSSVSNLPFGISVWQGLRQRLTRPTSAHFRARHSPVSGQLCGTAAGGAACRPGFLLPFGCRHSLLGPSCSRLGIVPFSRSAYPSPCRASGPRRGFHVPHERDTGGVGCPLYSGATVLTQPTKTHQLPPPLLHGQPCTPVLLLSSGAPSNEASSGVHSHSPIHPSPRLWSPDGTKTLGLFPSASHPTVTHDAREGRDRH